MAKPQTLSSMAASATDTDTKAAVETVLDTTTTVGTDTTTPEAEVIPTAVTETVAEVANTVETTQPTTTTTDNSGFQVEKPVTTTEDKIAAPVETITTENANQIVIKSLITQYLAFNDGNIMRSNDLKMKAGQMFREILKFGIENPEVPVLDAIYALFKEHGDRLLMPNIILATVSNMNKKIGERLLCLYTMFQMLISGTTELNDAVVRGMLAGIETNKIERILMYFTEKNK